MNPRRLKFATVATLTVLWILVVFSRSRVFTANTGLDTSWWMSLSTMLQQGSISGRDFQFTYGPLGQIIAWIGTLLSVSHSAWDALPMTIFAACSVTVLFFGVVMLLADRISWQRTIFVYVSLTILNLFLGKSEYRLVLLLLACVMIHRTVSEAGERRRIWFAAAAGIVCFIGQVATPEIGLYGLATALAVFALYAVHSRKFADAARLAVVSTGTFAAANVLISVAFKLTSSTYESLFAYQRYALGTMTGYFNGMGLPWELEGWRTLVFIAVSCSVIGSAVHSLRSRDFAEASLLTSLLIGSLFCLRSALVRSDEGHVVYGFAAMFFTFLVAGPWPLRSYRWIRVAWVGLFLALFAAWPYTSTYAFKDLQALVDGGAPPRQLWNQLGSHREFPAAVLPDYLIAAIGNSNAPMLSFPYDNYIPILLRRPLVAPVLQSYSAGTEPLEDYYVRELERYKGYGLEVIYGMDNIATTPIDGVQAVTKTPKIFEYLYKNFESAASDDIPRGYYLLRRAEEPRPTPNRAYDFRFVRENRNTGVAQLSSPSACGVARVEIKIDYPASRMIFRPNPLYVQLLRDKEIVKNLYLRPLATGNFFVAYFSTMKPEDFPRLFSSGPIPVRTWNALRFSVPRTDKLSVNPSHVEVRSVSCLDPDRFVIDDRPPEMVASDFKANPALLKGEAVTGWVKAVATLGNAPQVFVRLGHYSEGSWKATDLAAAALTDEASLDLKSAGLKDVGIAIVNPGAAENVVSLSLKDAQGKEAGHAEIRLGPGQEVSKMIDAFGWKFESVSTLTARAPQKFSIMAIEMNGSNLRTVPLQNVTAEVAEPLFPRFAFDGGWGTEIVLSNPSAKTMAGRVELRSPDNRVILTLPYTIEPGKALKLNPGINVQ